MNGMSVVMLDERVYTAKWEEVVYVLIRFFVFVLEGVVYRSSIYIYISEMRFSFLLNSKGLEGHGFSHAEGSYSYPFSFLRFAQGETQKRIKRNHAFGTPEGVPFQGLCVDTA